MKKITKLLAIAAGLISLTFISCKTQIIDATIANKDNVSSDETQKTLTLIATSRDKVVTFKNGNSRLIAPAALDGNELWFYLKTRKISGGDLALIKSPGQEDGVVSFTAYTGSTTEGSVNVTLDVENYELVLFAVEKNGEPKAPAFVEENAVLKATAYADLRYNESVKFFLMPISSDGQGDVKLSIYTDGWDLANDYPGYTADVYITKDLLTDNDTDALQKTASMDIPASKPDSYNFPASGVDTKTKAGTYNFIIDFTNGKKHFYYTDRIVVLANQVTEQEIILKNNIIDKPAEAPTNFYIGYRTPDKDDNDLSYLAEFAWKRNSNNEQYFKIEMLDVTEVVDSDKKSSDTHTYVDYIKAITKGTKIGDTLEADWDLLAGLTNTKKHTFDNTVYSIFDTSVADGITYYEDATEPGRLSKGSELLGLNIPLGRRYLARICACNAAGDSAYAYAKINGGEAAGDSGSSIFKYQNVSEWPEDAVAMNVFKITYNLVGGNFYDATYTNNVITLTNPPTTVTSQIKTSEPTEPIKISQYSVNSRGDAIIQYDCQSTTATNTVILNPLKVAYPTDKNAALYKGSNVWASWKENSTTAAENFRATTEVTKVLDPYTFADNAGTPPKTKIYGTKNLNLYAAYSSATAKIYNVADYAIKDADIKMYKSDKDTYGAAGATETAITNGATVSTKDADYIYILVKNNSKYATVLAELKQTDGTKVGTYESTQTTINEADVDNTYEVFRIVTTALQTRNFQLTLEAYDGIPSKSPYTYPINFTITD